MDRRSFLESSGLTVAGVVTVTSLAAFLEGCSSVPQHSAIMNGVTASVPKTVFLEGGKFIPVVQVNVPGKKFPVALVSDGHTFVQGFEMRCTHKSCGLNIEATSFVCPCHGSEFSLGGAVTKGPAKEALKPIPVDTTEDAYIFQISNS